MMGRDVLSPIEPARVKVLLLPAGNVKRSRFASFVSRLEEVDEVQLSDVSPAIGSGDNPFSPQAYPSGRVLFHFTTTERPPSIVESFPFELNREAQVVLALADGDELSPGHNHQHGGNRLDDALEAAPLQHLLGYLGKSDYKRALVHQLLVFDADKPEEDIGNIMFIPSPASSNITAIKAVMCDTTALLLSGMRELAGDLQQLPAIPSPYVRTPANQVNGSQDTTNNIQQRMSMPVSPSPDIRYGGTASSLPPTPTLSVPNEMSQARPRPPPLNVRSDKSSRDSSRDGQSVNEPGAAVPPSPRLAVSKGRLLVVLGSLLMQAGRWPDALKSLSDGVATARANNDNVWHARGLEALLICMLLFVWAEKPFEIPSVCLPMVEKRPRTEPTFYAPDASKKDLPNSNGVASESPDASTQYLLSLFTDLLSTILTLYTRASAFSVDKLPQILLCEAKLRLAALLIFIHLRKGSLDQRGLDYLFRGIDLKRDEPQLRLSPATIFRTEEIADMLLKSIPESSEHVPLTDSIDVLLGVSTLLSALGLARKQAFVLKEILSVVAPGLIEARKIGAAEMGIHPSAGLPMLHTSSKSVSPHLRHNISVLLSVVAEMYGVPYTVNRLLATNSPIGIELIGAKMRTWAHSRNFGDINLKVEILRNCISICEALPDLSGVLTFAIQLLRTTRNVITLPPTYMSGAPSLSQEEQVRLYNTIKQTVTAAGRLGQSDVFAEYWDEFLIRGIEPLEPPERSRLMIHSPRELAAAVSPGVAVKKDPFIYSSFAKAASKHDNKTVLTTNEMAYFTVVLQNPFEFDVDIDRISLFSDGCEFVASDHSIVLGSYCSQRFIMSGRPLSEGMLRITGCWARVRHCRERTFQIFTKQWTPKSPIKLNGWKGTIQQLSPSARNLNHRPDSVGPSDPEADILSLTVLAAQPSLSVANSTLSQSALMLLEGETKSFQITLENSSPIASADLLLFTYQDSATTQLQDALAGRELSLPELHELQLQLAGKPSLRWVPTAGDMEEPSIPAGATSTFTFEIFGKPGLLSGVIQVDYAHVGLPRSEIKEKFYTRQLRYPISLTVNGAIEIPRCNVLPFSGDFAWKNQQSVEQGLRSRSVSDHTSKANCRSDDDRLMPLLSRLGLGSHGSDHCLLLLDLRNVWPLPLSISIQIREKATKHSPPTDAWRRAYTVHEVLQPGHISRVVLLLPRIFVPEPHAPIPLIGNQRQFVVSASKLSTESEAANRENFWHREELLKYIRGSWREDSTGREGVIDMRKGIRLSARMIEAMSIDEIEIGLSVRALDATLKSGQEPSAKDSVRQTGRSHFILQPRTFATLVVSVHNHSADRIHLVLRLQPSLRNQSHNIALDLSKRFAWTGMLQRALHPPLEPGEAREAELGITALCEGDFEIGATVEELRVSTSSEAGQSSNAPLLAPKRRIWHAREPCLIDAVENRTS